LCDLNVVRFLQTLPEVDKCSKYVAKSFELKTQKDKDNLTNNSEKTQNKDSPLIGSGSMESD